MSNNAYTLILSTEQLIKNIQSAFFTGSICAQRGFFITKEEADDLRKKVTRPLKRNRLKRILKGECLLLYGQPK